MTVRLLVALVLTTTLAACEHPPPPPPPPPVKLTDAQKAEVKRLLEGRPGQLALGQRRDRAFSDAPTKVKLSARLCPVGRKELDIAPDITPSGLTVKLLQMTNIVEPKAKPVKPQAASPKPWVDFQAQEILSKLDSAFRNAEEAKQFVADARQTLTAEPPPFAMTLVLETLNQPELTSDKTFRAGNLAGQLYLWSEAAGAIVCAAGVTQQSSSEVRLLPPTIAGETAGRAMSSARLIGDLFVRAIDRGIDTLHAVAP